MKKEEKHIVVVNKIYLKQINKGKNPPKY